MATGGASCHRWQRHAGARGRAGHGCRKAAAENRERREAFTLRYTQLVGSRGDEAWRARSSGRLVTLVEHGDGTRTCSAGRAPCTPSDLAMQPPPGWVALKFLVNQPIPILEDDTDGIHCFGP